MSQDRRVQLLEPLVAQRIAAGEVIDRPASVVRELIDNSLDASASAISVVIEEGGIHRIKVIDDGLGIHPDDLRIIGHSHATSKVRTLSDFDTLETLGFRGEALYSIAAGAKVTISSTMQGTLGASITIHGDTFGPIEPGGPTRGTIVEVADLFAEIPARRLFLKRPSSEAMMVKQAIVEKALSFPHVTFTMSHNGKESLFLPATSLKGRVTQVLKNNRDVVASQLLEMHEEGEHFSISVISTGTETYRTDRKYIQIFVNNRIVDEYTFVQAVTYGYDPYLPGGAFPYCYVYLTVDPEYVDFNIHPAKREVKLRNRAQIHHQLVLLIQYNLRFNHFSRVQERKNSMEEDAPALFTPAETSDSIRAEVSRPQYPSLEGARSEPAQHQSHILPAGRHSGHSDTWYETAKELFAEERKPDTRFRPDSVDFIYHGQIFSLFLLVERGDSLFLVDQHAAHERILYDEMRQYDGFQPLMIPIEFEVERTVDTFLQNHGDMYRSLGIHLVRKQDLLWAIEATIPHYREMERDLIEGIQSFSSGTTEELHKLLFATAACRKAIKEGDSIDTTQAVALLRKVFALERPTCPHGREFVIEITREDLYRSVGRVL